ncbi:Myozenin-3 [Cricetulus griseus]|uniref:Myozenin-3 n=1 Tax=Cricetulus griseus TaxID=10029 RepID=G3HS44_CRIGR|nr:Myozenin-3 [Cricetulus griseus]
MIPKEQKEPVMAVTGDLAEPVPSLDLGKKLSVPQDLMIEELSLRNNPGSLLFQKRQRRVQKFTFELSESLQAVSKPSCALGEIKAKKEPVVSVKTPVPFGGPYVGETIFQAGTPFVPEPFSGLELLRLRPSFNRVAQGWVRKLPESEEL